MYEIRKYEESIYYLFLEGIMPGTIHQSTGEEASAVGMLYDLSHEDWMASTHRPAGHDIAKGISVKAMMCEMFGKARGLLRRQGRRYAHRRHLCGRYGGQRPSLAETCPSRRVSLWPLRCRRRTMWWSASLATGPAMRAPTMKR